MVGEGIFNNILYVSLHSLRIFNNILSHVTSIPLSTILILRICPSLCLISVGSINFSLLDNGLCSKRRYFQFASKCLYFMLFTCLSRMTEVGDGRAEVENPDSTPIATLEPRYKIRYFLLQSMNFPLYTCNFGIWISEVSFTQCFLHQR